MSNKKLLKHTSYMSLAVLISRIFGLLRDILDAYLFGTGFMADALKIAYRIPNLLRKLFGEGALSAAFIPIYKSLGEKEGKQSQINFAMNMLLILTFVLSILSIIGILFAPFIIKLLAPGFDSQTSILTIKLTRILFPYLFFIGLSSTLISILNSHDKFFIPGLSSAFLNIGIFISCGIGYFLHPKNENWVYIFAFGILFGGFLQTIINFPQLKKIGYTFHTKIKFQKNILKELWYKFIPGLIGIGVRQINLIADQILATFLVSGSIAALDYGNRLMLLPMGIFGVSASTAALPMFSKLVAQEKWDELNDRIRFSIIFLCFIMIPITVIIFLFGDDFIRILFLRGKFNLRSLDMTYKAFAIYSSGLTIYAINRILTPVYFANKDTKTPLKISIVVIIFNIILNIILMKFFALAGLALASVISSFLNFFLLLRTLHNKYKPIHINGILFQIMKLLLIAFILGVVTYLADSLFQNKNTLVLIFKTSVFTSCYFTIYLIIASWIKIPYIQEIRNKLWKRK